MEIAVAAIAVLLGATAAVLAVLLVRAREEAVRASATADERVAQADRRLADFDRLRQESLAAANAAVLATAQTLSSKLIDDHRRETAEARKEGEERVRQASEHLVRQVGDIAKAVAELNGQVQEKGRVLDTVWRSLSSPGGAGQLAEIGLANTLKGFGLEQGRDYVLQVTTEDAVTGQRLRPDALVFLPGNSALIIDCKASKFLIEIAEAEGGAGEGEAYVNLARTMNQHLKALGDKNYRGAVQAAWRELGRGEELGRILSVMYLPNEGAVEKLCRADPGFLHRAREAQIIPAGPAGLHCALSLAAAEINTQRQVENQQRILDLAQALLEGVSIALGHAAAVGRGIKSAAESFAKLTGSVNQRLLPRARKLAQLGVQPGRPLPASLPNYVVHSLEADQLIEGDAAELGEEPAPAHPPILLAE